MFREGEICTIEVICDREHLSASQNDCQLVCS